MADIDVLVRATALRWFDADSFPTWLEVCVIDHSGRRHLIREKEPVLLREPVRFDVSFPFPLWLDASAQVRGHDQVEIALGHGVETVDGASTLVVGASDVVRL